MKMDNLSDMYYLIRFIVARIFVYLRDVILHELSWFPEEINDLDASGAKPRGHLFTKRAIADFVAFFTICAVFGSFIVLSTKCSKETEDNYDNSSRPVSPESEGEPLELVDDDEYTISGTPIDTERQSPWGDTIIDESNLETIPDRRNFLQRDRIYRTHKNGDAISSVMELRSSNSQHSQRTQTNDRIIQRATNKRDWLIRRTRSGHVYGKYPM